MVKCWKMLRVWVVIEGQWAHLPFRLMDRCWVLVMWVVLSSSFCCWIKIITDWGLSHVVKWDDHPIESKKVYHFLVFTHTLLTQSITNRWSHHTSQINSLSWTSDNRHCASGSLDTSGASRMLGGTSVSKMPVWVGSILYSGLKMEVGRRREGWLVLVRMCVLGSGRLHSTRNACVGRG